MLEQVSGGKVPESLDSNPITPLILLVRTVLVWTNFFFSKNKKCVLFQKKKKKCESLTRYMTMVLARQKHFTAKRQKSTCVAKLRK